MEENHQDYDLKKIILGDNYQDHHNDFSHLYKVTEEVLEKIDNASVIDARYKDYQSMDLADVFYGNLGADTLYRVQFYVLHVAPLNLYEFTQLFCPKCYQTFSFKTHGDLI